MHNYSIRISGIKDGVYDYHFNINSKFFESFVNSEVESCEIKAIVTLYRGFQKSTLCLSINGTVILPCDLCSSKMSVNVSNKMSMLIEQNNFNLENTDEIIYVSANDHEINIRHLIYESVILSIPSQRNHKIQNRECDQSMEKLIDKYSKRKNKIDPRWEKLNELKNLR